MGVADTSVVLAAESTRQKVLVCMGLGKGLACVAPAAHGIVPPGCGCPHPRTPSCHGVAPADCLAWGHLDPEDDVSRIQRVWRCRFQGVYINVILVCIE